MKTNRFIVQSLVVVAVIISFILTYLIWTNNSRYKMHPDNDSEKNKVNIQNVVKKNYLYSPSQILWNDGKDEKLVYNNKHNVVNSVQKDMETWKFGKIKVQFSNDPKKYDKFLNGSKSLQLLYPLKMPLNYYGKLLGKKDIDKRNDYMFSRVLFYFNKKDKNIYFGNDKNHTIYRVSVKSGNSKNMMKFLHKTDFSIAVSQNVNKKGVNLNYIDRLSLKPYSYLISKQEDNSYISSLLGSDNISTRRQGEDTIYSSSTYQRLVSNNSKNTLTFYDYSKSHLPKNKEQMLNRGIDVINQINSPLSNAKLSYVDWKNKVLVYREYVEGLPTFDKSDFGAVRISFGKSEQITQFSNRVIQVPVPSDQTPVTLLSTKELMNTLTSHGVDISKITSIDLGYKWEKDQTNNEIINLIPQYFIRINNTWKSLYDLTGVSDQVGGGQ